MAVESHQCSQGRERGKKEGDDYPARIYVTFQYDSQKVSLFGKAKYEAAKLIYGQYPPLGAINYIWESRAPVGTTVALIGVLLLTAFLHLARGLGKVHGELARALLLSRDPE